jgi:hypothetical protein
MGRLFSFSIILAVVAALLTAPAWAQEKIMRQDTNEDGKIDQIALFDRRGKIIKLEIDSNADELMDRFQYYEREQIIWFYNGDEEAIRAEKDLTGDSRVDTWYHYHKGSLITVEEDTNADGKPDLWEEFDESEAMVKRLIDLNYDGKPDVVEYGEGERG